MFQYFYFLLKVLFFMFDLRQSLSVTNELEEHLQYLCCSINFYANTDPSILSLTQLIYLMVVISHSISGSWLVHSYFAKRFSSSTRLTTAEWEKAILLFNFLIYFFFNRNSKYCWIERLGYFSHFVKCKSINWRRKNIARI